MVTKPSQLSVETQRRLVPPVKRPLPIPGDKLRRAVDTVLAGLDRETPDVHRLDDALRTALAWTAAVGDTCRCASAVRQVRIARAGFAAADLDQARDALVAARDGLQLVPNQRSLR